MSPQVVSRATTAKMPTAPDDESGGNAELYTRSTDKGTMNILDLKQSTITNTANKFQSIFSTTLIRFPHIIGILHCDHCSRHVSHFLVRKTHNFAKHLRKNAEVSIPEKPSEVPESARLDVWRLLPQIEARALVVLGVHRSAFGEQQLRSRDAAGEGSGVQRRHASGGFSGEPVGRCGFWRTKAQRSMRRGRTTEVVGMRSWNNECFGLHIFKTVQGKKHSQTH